MVYHDFSLQAIRQQIAMILTRFLNVFVDFSKSICYSKERVGEATLIRSVQRKEQVIIMSPYEILVIILMISMLIIEVIRISKDK